MELSNDDLRRAEVGILDFLENAEEPSQPSQLMKQLSEQGISEYSARVALWYLIDRNQIELTMDRLLRSVHRSATGAARRSPALARG